jgi:hypothetical protein
MEEPSLAYTAKANARPVLFVVGIPYPLLKVWQEYMVKQNEMQKIAEEDRAGENENTCPCQDNLDFVDASLRKFAGMVKSAYNKAKGGHKRKELNSCVRRFHLLEGMTISVKEFQRENENICDELEKWKQSYKDLHEGKKSFIWRWFLLCTRRMRKLKI